MDQHWFAEREDLESNPNDGQNFRERKIKLPIYV
jgi:hypothetical protein